MTVKLRSWRAEDAESLARYADNPAIASNLRDGFPSPYTLKAAKAFVAGCLEADRSKKLFLAVEADGAAVGSVGVFKKDDVYRKSAELGYWLGQPYWGRGIMTHAVRLAVRMAFERFDIVRIEAGPYAGNAGSRRVLEKAGFTLEGIHKSSVFKNGQLGDSCTYALLRPDPADAFDNDGR